jgi:hypothetical protein
MLWWSLSPLPGRRRKASAFKQMPMVDMRHVKVKRFLASAMIARSAAIVLTKIEPILSLDANGLSHDAKFES